jgi:hypothetical protein
MASPSIPVYETAEEKEKRLAADPLVQALKAAGLKP